MKRELLILDLVRLVDQFEGGQPTVMTWNIANDGVDVALPRVEDGDYEFVVDWGDGTPVQRNIFEHHFKKYRVPPRATRWSRKLRVTITGKFHGLSFEGKRGNERLVSIEWGFRGQTCTRPRKTFPMVFQSRNIHRDTQSHRRHQYEENV